MSFFKLYFKTHILFLFWGIFFLENLQGKEPSDALLVKQFEKITNKIIAKIEKSNSEPNVSISVLLNLQTNHQLDSFKKNFIARLKKNPLKKEILKHATQILEVFYINNIKTNLRVFLVKDLMLAIDLLSKNIEFKYAQIQKFDIEIQKIFFDEFNLNPDLISKKDTILYEYALANKHQIIPLLIDHPDILQANKLISIGLKENLIDMLFAIQHQNKKINVLYKKSDNIYFKTLCQISQLKNKSLFFPFFEEIANKELSLQTIQEKGINKASFFAFLIEQRLKHLSKIQNGQDTPLNFSLLFKTMVQKADRYFITPINQRHFLEDTKRFLSIKNFSLKELYYLIVCGDDVLYTSSFNFIYKKFILLLSNKKKGVSLLEEVKYDKFRKFIKILASFNYLQGEKKMNFFSYLDSSSQINLLKIFLENIPLNQKDYVEEACDVVNSFTGFSKKTPLLNTVFESIQKKINASIVEKNKKAEIVYDIIKQIFEFYFYNTNPSIENKLLFSNLKTLSLQELVDETKKTIYEQVFFYGDDDAKVSFDYLLYTFKKNPAWKVSFFSDWVCISSKKGLPIKIYANKAAYLDSSEYPMSQFLLKNYFLKNNISPAIIAHRGHSYFLFNTLNQLNPFAKLLFLGSCGSNSLIQNALRICPSAQIISTRQIANSVVNSVFFYAINEELRKGNNIKWELLWQKLSFVFKKTGHYETFAEYIPPYSNLSILFFSLYYKRMSELY